MLKRALDNSQGDFTIVVDAIHHTLTHQIHKVKGSMEIDRFKVPNVAPTTWLFSKIVHCIHALLQACVEGLGVGGGEET